MNFPDWVQHYVFPIPPFFLSVLWLAERIDPDENILNKWWEEVIKANGLELSKSRRNWLRGVPHSDEVVRPTESIDALITPLIGSVRLAHWHNLGGAYVKVFPKHIRSGVNKLIHLYD